MSWPGATAGKSPAAALAVLLNQARKRLAGKHDQGSGAAVYVEVNRKPGGAPYIARDRSWIARIRSVRDSSSRLRANGS